MIKKTHHYSFNRKNLTSWGEKICRFVKFFGKTVENNVLENKDKRKIQISSLIKKIKLFFSISHNYTLIASISLGLRANTCWWDWGTPIHISKHQQQDVIPGGSRMHSSQKILKKIYSKQWLLQPFEVHFWIFVKT